MTEEAVLRELEEESGLTGTVARLIGVDSLHMALIQESP